MNDYIFKDDWFSANIPVWKDTFSKVNRLPLNVLEIGSHEGRSCVWLCENVLTHPKSHIDCVDIFENEEIFKNFKHNISNFSSKVTYYKGSSDTILKKQLRSKKYEVIYIDGDHTAAGTLRDAILAWPLLKKNGIIIFDDFLGGGNKFNTLEAPTKGILAFIDCYSDQLATVHAGYQLIVCRIKE